MPSTLAWTGERMVPHASDTATELYHWQRYLFFRPWYEDAKVIDAASGEGYGTSYAATFAAQAQGLDVSTEAVDHANARYPRASFSVADVCEADYSDADIVISFETIEHVPDPIAFLKALATCKGRIVVSTPNRKTHSPGNKLEDKPFNQFHTVEWTPFEFANVVTSVFPNRAVKFLSQEQRWPGLIREGLDDEAMYCIAVVLPEGDGGEGAWAPVWPRLGIAMPTHCNAKGAIESMAAMSRFYPGDLTFAVVANGCPADQLEQLLKFETSAPYLVKVIVSDENLGYGVGANKGLEWLERDGQYDLFGVVNDDVYPSVGCLSEMAMAFVNLAAAGHKPGVLGPVSDRVNGNQQVLIGSFTNIAELQYCAEGWLAEHNRSVSQAIQVRGLFMLISPECLTSVGGFDPRFGIGNFEDDDHNLRTRLAGFTLWIADGAFLHHQGSTTFRKMEVDYQANIQRNAEQLAAKWGLENPDQWVNIQESEVSLNVSLSSEFKPEFPINLNGETIDLINQASDLEFAAWVMNRLKHRPREDRAKVVSMFVN